MKVTIIIMAVLLGYLLMTEPLTLKEPHGTLLREAIFRRLPKVHFSPEQAFKWLTQKEVSKRPEKDRVAYWKKP